MNTDDTDSQVQGIRIFSSYTPNASKQACGRRSRRDVLAAVVNFSGKFSRKNLQGLLQKLQVPKLERRGSLRPLPLFDVFSMCTFVSLSATSMFCIH